MGKYDPLGSFLRKGGHSSMPMTFAQIEQVIAAELPKSAYEYRAWWSNNTFNNTMTHVWLEAGYETENVDMAGQKLVFRKT